MQTSLFRRSAVLIERNLLHRRLYEDVLTANGFNVYVAKSAMEGLLKIKEAQQDLTVIDVEIAEEHFVEKLIPQIRLEHNSKFMPIIGLSVYDEESKQNIKKMLDAFLTKPFSTDRFVELAFFCIENKISDCKNLSN